MSISGQKKIENQVKSFINLLRRDLRAKDVSYAAIAYDWNIKKDGAEKIADVEICLVGLEGVKNIEKEIFKHELKLRQNSVQVQEGIAGILQRLDVNYNRYSYYFEHDLSYILLKYIYRAIKKGYRNILIQGPTFPELYKKLSRMLLKKDISIYIVTFDDRLFSFDINDILPLKTFKMGNEKDLKLGEVLVRDLDENETIKRYAVFRKDNIKCIVDTFCQSLDESDKNNVRQDRKLEGLNEIFTLPGVVYLRDLSVIQLPFAFAVAFETVRKEGVSMKDMIYHQEMNVINTLKANILEVAEYDRKTKEEGVLYSDRLEPEEVVMLATLIELKRDRVQDIITDLPKIREEINKIKDGKIPQKEKVITATRNAFLKLDMKGKHEAIKELLRRLLSTS